MDESSDALDSAVYAAELYNRIKQEQMMGLNSIMGQGMVGNAATLAHTTKPSYPYKENKPRVDMHLKITQAENGFIVSVASNYGDVLEPHIAVTIEDVCTIITSQLASRMLDRSE